jgi:hypothetical protein
MSKLITIEVPDTLFAVIEKAAARSGSTPSEMIVKHLSDQLASSVKKREQAQGRFRSHAGEIDTGDPSSADNDRIDLDLAREYAGSRE